MCLHIIHIGDEMGNMTLSIPEDLHKRMRKRTELKWSDIARQAFEKKLREIEFAEGLLSKSELTEEDAERIGHKVKAKMRKRFSS
jgi:predicted CopG family antitoxin